MALIRNELFKLFRMKKTYVFFMILFVMTVVPVYYFLHPESGVMTIVEGANAQALPLVLLASLAQFLGIFMAIYVAEILTDEYKNGTLKLSMMHSAGRIRLLYSKVAAVMAFNAIMLAFSLLITYIVGIIAFGWGENFIFNGATYSTGEGLWMTLSAYAVSLIPYMGFGMMAVFISICAENMTNALVITIGIFMSGQYLNAIPVLRNCSVVVQMYLLHENFVKTYDIVQAFTGIAVSLAHIIVFYLLSLYVFKKKDILC